MKNLNSKTLNEFLLLAVNDLRGNWLLVGGTLLPAVGLDVRTTVDIDLIGLGPEEQLQNLELMEVAEKLELSVETINQAAAFFLKKIKYTTRDLIPLKSGKSAKVYRPSVALYWALKVARLSESDALDCQHYLNYCKGQKDKIDFKKLEQILSQQQKKENSHEKHERLSLLRALIPSD